MTDQVLDVLKIGLLCLLYLFFVRVLWAVWTEVRTAEPAAVTGSMGNQRAPSAVVGAARPSAATPAPAVVKAVPTRLTIIEPADRFGTSYPIGNSIPIGRDAEGGIKITDDSFVSGKHARVSLIAGKVFVEDAGSRNGTYVNGVRISEQTPLQAGDRLQIGYTVLEAG